MAKWILYHTQGCHLCEQAKQLIDPLLSADSSLALIDIMTDDKLIEEYQVSIPVLKNEQGQRLYWPFTAQHVQAFLAKTE